MVGVVDLVSDKRVSCAQASKPSRCAFLNQPGGQAVHRQCSLHPRSGGAACDKFEGCEGEHSWTKPNKVEPTVESTDARFRCAPHQKHGHGEARSWCSTTCRTKGRGTPILTNCSPSMDRSNKDEKELKANRVGTPRPPRPTSAPSEELPPKTGPCTPKQGCTSCAIRCRIGAGEAACPPCSSGRFQGFECGCGGPFGLVKSAASGQDSAKCAAESMEAGLWGGPCVGEPSCGVSQRSGCLWPYCTKSARSLAMLSFKESL